MSEPTSAVVAVLLFISGVAAVIDPHLLSGAFIGGTLFVLLSTEYTPLKRICLMFASIGLGYLAAPEIQNLLGLSSGVIPAILLSAVGVVIIEMVRRGLKKLDLEKYIPGRRE